MFGYKLFVVFIFGAVGFTACLSSNSGHYAITGSKAYEASLFRQNCAICHGAEGEGKVLDNGTIVPNLRKGSFKAVTEEQIYRQIADGGNGMLPFRRQLSDREIRLLVTLIKHDLRGQ